MSDAPPMQHDTAAGSAGHGMPWDVAGALARILRDAIASTQGVSTEDADPVIRASTNPKFGDYQANFAMALSKRLGRPPRDIASSALDAARGALAAIADPPEIAGPGFVNIRVRTEALGAALSAMDRPGLGVADVKGARTIAVDLCGVNVAKQMHVGHLRATIIGDTIARLHERMGWRVWRENHLGDWGLPIAMVLASLRRRGADLDAISLADLNAAYRAAQAESADDEAGLAAARATGAGPHRIIELECQHEGASAAAEHARRTLRLLQSGDAATVADWHKLIEVTMHEVFETAQTLGVDLRPEHSRGESFYRDRLAATVDAFVRSGLGTQDQGAIIVRFPERERPLLIRKSDGAFLYATTDLAAVRFRVHDLGAERVVYCVDARQRDHFTDVFDACRMIGWTRRADGSEADLRHAGFGAVLGADKRPLKTRSGENFTLKALLDEAVQRGTAEVRRRAEDPQAPTHGMGDAELDRIGRAVGIAAVKYADLSSDIARDYVFDLDRMISFEGDTGPYLLYAHARICAILSKAGEMDAAATITPAAPEERALALLILRWPSTVAEAAQSLEPNRICGYLFSLAGAFSAFYQACPVIKAEDAAVRASRLRLCALTRRVLADGLGILGIDAPPRM
jgi:arginyl-tRNA synthetase